MASLVDEQAQGRSACVPPEGMTVLPSRQIDCSGAVTIDRDQQLPRFEIAEADRPLVPITVGEPAPRLVPQPPGIDEASDTG